MFTAVSGSGGAELRFSTAFPSDFSPDVGAFVSAMRIVTIPPDCLFTVRFGAGTWHQFLPRKANHPALFALSCHTNELGGDLDPLQLDPVLANLACIPALTELLPAAVRELVDRTGFNSVPIVALALRAPGPSMLLAASRMVRAGAGRLRRLLSRSTDSWVGRTQ